MKVLLAIDSSRPSQDVVKHAYARKDSAGPVASRTCALHVLEVDSGHPRVFRALLADKIKDEGILSRPVHCQRHQRVDLCVPLLRFERDTQS